MARARRPRHGPAHDPLPPLDPAIVRFVESLARVVALRDHRAALAARDAAKAKQP